MKKAKDLLVLAFQLEAADINPCPDLTFLDGVIGTLLYIEGTTKDAPVKEEDLHEKNT